MCFKTLPVVFDEAGKAHLREGAADPYVYSASTETADRQARMEALLAPTGHIKEFSIAPVTREAGPAALPPAPPPPPRARIPGRPPPPPVPAARAGLLRAGRQGDQPGAVDGGGDGTDPSWCCPRLPHGRRDHDRAHPAVGCALSRSVRGHPARPRDVRPPVGQVPAPTDDRPRRGQHDDHPPDTQPGTDPPVRAA